MIYQQVIKMELMINSQMEKSDVNLGYLEVVDNDLDLICRKNCRDVTRVNLTYNNITSMGILRLIGADWSKLTELWLCGNKIGDKGCKYLTKTSISNIQTLLLRQNEIASAGVLHLSKGQWKKMKKLHLGEKSIKIQAKAIRWLITANWKKMYALSLIESKLGISQIKTLLLIESKYLYSVWLWKNPVDDIDKIQLRTMFKEKNGQLKLCL